MTKVNGRSFIGSATVASGVLATTAGGAKAATIPVDRKPREFRMMGMPRRSGSQSFHFDHVRNFLDCIESREKPNADVEIHHRAVNACHLANIAARLETYVSWDPATEKIGGDERAKSLVGRRYRAPWKLPGV